MWGTQNCHLSSSCIFTVGRRSAAMINWASFPQNIISGCCGKKDKTRLDPLHETSPPPILVLLYRAPWCVSCANDPISLTQHHHLTACYFLHPRAVPPYCRTTAVVCRYAGTRPCLVLQLFPDESRRKYRFSSTGGMTHAGPKNNSA